MNAIRTLKLAGAALIVVASVNAWAQESESSATSTATQGTSKSAIKKKANRTLSKKVAQALSKGGVNTAGIKVFVKGGAVTLAGSVTDSALIDKAASIAKGVSGVTSVNNALTVREGRQ